ncbi:hypothetical protein C8F01DRAFT_1225200 [Mycena amicta]|nr:hypothetical protein C8F01DRAFT_1225200 [Mycena amicta]
MFHKSSFVFCALVASGAVAAPVMLNNARAAATACNETLVQDLISQLSDEANTILNVGFVLPDPDRATAEKAATFDTLVTAIGDAAAAAAKGDFATAQTKIAFVDTTANDLVDGEIADGLESGDDLKLIDLAGQASDAVNACVAPGAAAAAPAAPAAPAPAAAQPAAPVGNNAAIEDAAAPATCDAPGLASIISDLTNEAQLIKAVGFVLPDPDRANAAKAASFDQLILAIDDAANAIQSGDFATAQSKLAFVDTTANDLVDGEIADGLESGADLTLIDLAGQASDAVKACV